MTETTAQDERRSSRTERWVQRRFSSKAMRPRNAAYLISAIWILGVIVFGIRRATPG